MEHKLDVWKNKLLDLGKQNKLLNYRDTRQANLRIIAPDLWTLWDCFVCQEKSLAFSSAGTEALSTGDSRPQKLTEMVTANLYANPAEQLRTLRNLRGRARSFMEEHGVNALFLSFGFLRWTDDVSGQSYDAPLLLVPGHITLESITAPFLLTRSEDEIMANPTLIYKLERDFGISLPEFSLQDTPEQYFQAVSSLITGRDWKIIPEVGLGMLSFLKINLYQDLENHRTELLENPIVRAIGGDSTALTGRPDALDVVDHERNLQPNQIFQVVDADSSQQEALLFARQGHSFILQGPPGTGKSQTITNLIAECLADGKKVLFVSEKMAALEVVHRRLTEVGLSDFCLILHNYQASKKETLDQLGNVLHLAQSAPESLELDDDLFDQLTEHRDLLNAGADAMFTMIEPLHRTIYEVNGRLAELRNVPDVAFSIPNVRQTDRSQYRQYQTALRKLANSVEAIGGCIFDQPWRGCNLRNIESEFQIEATEHLHHLISASQTLDSICDELNQSLCLNIAHNPIDIQTLKDFLETAAQSPLVPFDWVLTEAVPQFIQQVEHYAGQMEDFQKQRNIIYKLQERLATHKNAEELLKFHSLANTEEIDAFDSAVRKLLRQDLCYAAWDHLEDWTRVTEVCHQLESQLDIYETCSKQLLVQFDERIFELEPEELSSRLQKASNGFLHHLNPNYHKARNQMRVSCRMNWKEMSDVRLLEALERLRERNSVRDWLRKNGAMLRETLGDCYQGTRTSFPQIQARMESYQILKRLLEELAALRLKICKLEENHAFQKQCGERYASMNTNWSELITALQWAEKFRASYKILESLTGNAEANTDFIKLTQDICTRPETVQTCAVYLKRLEHILTEFQPEFDWFSGLFDRSENLSKLSLTELAERLEACQTALPELSRWLDCQTAAKECCMLGLEEYIQQINACSIESDEIIPVFEKHFYRLWLNQVCSEFPATAEIYSHYGTQATAAAEFAHLDRLQLSIARNRIRARLLERLPSPDRFTSSTAENIDEIGILKQELGKRRRVRPLRRLFAEIPELILALKPCLMMSPLSVSMFLESDQFRFDTVIFDEASQIRTENALGAILRGKQVIIAGDRNQLPPANFFAPSDFDHAGPDTQPEDSAFDSILEEAALLPERTLLWHYRSRHEQLISFSNQNIYHGSLLTFPSPMIQESNLGVDYTYIPNGVYNRSKDGRKGNLPEAEKVAQMVFEHFRRFPDRSLGVITFGEVQQMAIDAALQELRLKNQRFESFFEEDRPDAFFIKSLENVQGDERDTIIFSIGYARNADGVLHMQFGPLSKSGGERRLNVGITRAKYNLKLVGSILPVDIDPNQANAEGPRLLREYIAFAMRNSSVRSKAPVQRELWQISAFEKSICDFLQERGYLIDVQIGSSNCRVDIAVRSPAREDCYVLGILCDGASYHAARTTRERDRLRQDVLESLGWRIYRVWSADWVQDATMAETQLAAAVEAALADEAAEIAVEEEREALAAVEAAEAAMEAEAAALAESVEMEEAPSKATQLEGSSEESPMVAVTQSEELEVPTEESPTIAATRAEESEVPTEESSMVAATQSEKLEVPTEESPTIAATQPEEPEVPSEELPMAAATQPEESEISSEESPMVAATQAKETEIQSEESPTIAATRAEESEVPTEESSMAAATQPEESEVSSEEAPMVEVTQSEEPEVPSEELPMAAVTQAEEPEVPTEESSMVAAAQLEEPEASPEEAPGVVVTQPEEPEVPSEEAPTAEEAQPKIAVSQWDFDPPQKTDLMLLPEEDRRYLGLNGCIQLIVAAEYPIHTSILSQRLLPAMGWEKSTPATRRQIDIALQEMETQILRKGSFLYPVDYTKIPARPANGRNIQQISDDELAEGMYRTAQRYPGLTRRKLLDETTHAFGFSRQGVKINEALERVYSLLKKNGVL